MGWNDSGDQKNPWQSGGDKGPPDLDAVVRDLQRKLAGLFGGRRGGNGVGGRSGGSGSGFIFLVALIAAVVWLASGIYTVDESERGVVLRFGKFSSLAMPGLRWRIPWPVDTVELISVTRTEAIQYNARMLTEDENMVDIHLIIQYRRADPQAFVFNVKDAEGTLEDVARSAIREVVGKSELDFVITEGRAEIASRTKTLIQTTLDAYGTGIEIYEVNLQDAQFPSQVEESVQDAVKAREDQERMVFEAQSYANDIVPKARGAAARLRQEAEAYRERVIADAEGEASRFDQVRTEFEKAPEVTRQRIYLETLEQIMASSTKVIMDGGDGSGNLIYLPLDRLMEGRSRAAQPNTAASSPLNFATETAEARDGRGQRRNRDR